MQLYVKNQVSNYPDDGVDVRGVEIMKMIVQCTKKWRLLKGIDDV